MKVFDVCELIEHIDEVLRMVEKEGETIEVTNHREVITHLVPVRKPQPSLEQSDDTFWTDLERLAAEISAIWLSNISAVDAVRNVRRDLT
jgi:antitoxin (DNA-binding transcriptional repressor) of toxin-antitoxin stability system